MIFVDTSAWIAVVLEKDQYHKSAVETFDELTVSPAPLITTDFVISETYTYLKYHTANVKSLLKFEDILSRAETERLLKLRWTHPETFQAARGIFFKYCDQRFSFVDCVSFATLRALKIREAFAYDNDFRTMGFKLIPN